MSTWPGIMMPIRMNQKNTLPVPEPHPGQRERGHARGDARCRSAMSVEVMKLAAYQLRMSPCSSSVRNDSSVGFSIFQVGLVVSALGLIAVSMAQASGTSQRSANAMSTPAQKRLNSGSGGRRETAERGGARRSALGARSLGERWSSCHISGSWRRVMTSHTAETASTTRKNSVDAAAA